MSADLDDQLAIYGRWVERQCATGLRPAHPPVIARDADFLAVHSGVDIDVDTAPPLPRPHRRVLLAVAACVIVVVGIGGLVVTNRHSTPPAAPLNDSVSPADPPEALFVLPDPSDGYALANGDTSTSRPDGPPATESFAPNGVLLGVADGTGYTALRSVSIYDSSPIANGEWDPVETPTGPAYLSTEPQVAVAQQRNDRWILVATRSDSQLALDLLDAVSVDEDNELKVDVPDDHVVIHRYTTPAAGVSYTTYFEATSPDGALIIVETATASTPLFPAASVADRIEPTQIDGAHAWIATRADPDGEWNGLVWNETPNRFVAVSGQTSIDTITELAHRLHVVDDTAWTSALPAATPD